MTKKIKELIDYTKYTWRWKNRQRMAWYSFWLMIGMTLLMWFGLPVWYYYMNVNATLWATTVSSSMDWFYITFGSVILGYMGTSMLMSRDGTSQPSTSEEQESEEDTSQENKQ